MSTAMRVRAGTSVIAMLTIVATVSCSNGSDSEPAATSTPTTVAEPPSTTRPSCEAAVPAAWQQAIDGSGVDTGGVSNVPMAVGRAGEVVVSRDNGDTRDLLLVGPDKTVTEIYAVPEPNRNDVGSVAMDDRWVVVGVDRIPHGANGVLPTLIRIDVIDRQDNSVRTVVQRSDAEYSTGGPTLDTYAGDTGTVRSYDLGTGAVADVATGDMGDARATAVGLFWATEGRRGYPDLTMWSRTEVKFAAPLPTPVDEALGTGPDRLSLATDGTAYAWITGVDQGGTGVAWWSAESGLVRVTGDVVAVSGQLTEMDVVGPYVVIDRGRPDDYETFATVVDTRSGAFTYLRESVGGADGGTIAVGLGAKLKTLPTTVGIVRTEVLRPLSC